MLKDFIQFSNSNFDVEYQDNLLLLLNIGKSIIKFNKNYNINLNINFTSIPDCKQRR